MLPWLGERVGNPSGAHRMARAARRAIDDARDVFAAVTGFEPGDIVFTGCGTEADNLAIAGVLDAVPGGVAVCPATEHHAVLHPVEVTGGRIVAVDPMGQVDLDSLWDVLDERVAIVSVMTANNETGVITDVGAVIEVVRTQAPNAVVHTDAVQAMSWLDLGEHTAGVDLLSLSAHKFGGPQGVGVLAVRPGTPLRAQLIGGGQERDRRSGTQNVAGICGAAAAAAATAERRIDTVKRIGALRDRLADGLLAAIPELTETAVVDGDRSNKVAGNLHLCLPGMEAEPMLVLLEDRDVYASAASSCSSGAQQPSHVLAAMGIAPEVAQGSLRLSFGWSSTDEDVDVALGAIPDAVERMRAFL